MKCFTSIHHRTRNVRFNLSPLTFDLKLFCLLRHLLSELAPDHPLLEMYEHKHDWIGERNPWIETEEFNADELRAKYA